MSRFLSCSRSGKSLSVPTDTLSQDSADSIKGWSNPEGDVLYEALRNQVDNAGPQERKKMYGMMLQIGKEMHLQTGAFILPSSSHNGFRVLDLCMAPGGFSATALEKNSDAVIRGISLPDACGGHPMLLEDIRVKCQFLDITMLATEFGVSPIPQNHPEHSSFITNRPYHGESFELVLCDGQCLRTHHRPEHRAKFEALRLRTSQLILALQRIATGGTLVMLLHKADAWDTAQLLHQFNQFSAIQLFKPEKKHNHRNSFYLVAKNVQPHTQAAQAAVSGWKETWRQATFGGPEGTGAFVAYEDAATVHELIDDFGTKLIELARPIWKIQGDALLERGIAVQSS